MPSRNRSTGESACDHLNAHIERVSVGLVSMSILPCFPAAAQACGRWRVQPPWCPRWPQASPCVVQERPAATRP